MVYVCTSFVLSGTGSGCHFDLLPFGLKQGTQNLFDLNM